MAEQPIRKIIHVDMDAFYASVEQRDNPELRGKPVAVGGSRERGVVAAASYEARKFGVKSAMASKIAYQRCPHIIFVRARFEVYKEVSKAIREIFSRHTDLIEPLSLDEAYLDVTENKMGFETATEVAMAIKQSIKEELNLVASAGISINKFLAKVASDMDKPDGLYVIQASKIDRFVADLEVKKFFGVGKVTMEKMHRMGVYRGKDLQRYSEEEMKRRFGKSGAYYYNICRGIDHRPVNPNRIRKSLGAERTFEVDLIEELDLTTEINRISEEVARRIEKAKAFGKTITLKVKFNDFTQITRSQTRTEPYVKLDDLAQSAKELLRQLDDDHLPIRLMGITVSNFETKKPVYGTQLTLSF